tara:strand:+ start:132 stop:740 length:609 start_codon:yes stop_codon:yes gene_type:complete
MTLEMLVSTALMEYTLDEQTRILKSLEEQTKLPSARLRKGMDKVMEVLNTWEPIVEGYAGFPVERDHIDKKKREHDKDRNIGRVVRHGNDSFVITGKKNDGRYIIVGKKGEKTAKAPEDMGLQAANEAIGIDIEDLHQEMLSEAKKTKGKVKRWWDDDGDGKGYEKGEVKKTKKEEREWVTKLRDTGVFTEEELTHIAGLDS